MRRAALFPGRAARLAGLAALALATAVAADEAAHFEVPAAAGGGPLTFLAYGDTRFTQRGGGVANGFARRALVAHMAAEHPAAIFIGGDLVFEGSDPADYATFRRETAAWSEAKIPLFPVLGNHELRGCAAEATCLENWWSAFPALRGQRWYSVTVAGELLVLLLDSDAALKPHTPQRVWFEHEIAGAGPAIRFIMVVMHYPPVSGPFYPHAKDEREIARYFARHAAALRARVLVVGSHVHNYERFREHDVTYLVSGGGGAKPLPAIRLFGELSRLKTGVNFHYLRLTLSADSLRCDMVRFEATEADGQGWSEPDHFELRAQP